MGSHFQCQSGIIDNEDKLVFIYHIYIFSFICWCPSTLNTLRPTQIGCHFAEDIFKCIFFNENVWISIKISLKFGTKGPSSNIPALLAIMVWRQPGDKPLSEPMMVRLLMHICVTRPQWVEHRNEGLRTWQVTWWFCWNLFLCKLCKLVGIVLIHYHHFIFYFMKHPYIFSWG